jgi:hypothetical protein
MASSPSLRVSDADRDAAAERLRDAAADGRLDPDELEERVAAAYSAKTAGELTVLTEDLPERPPEPPSREPVWQSQDVRARLASFIVANTVCVAIWAATGANGSFWPVWVMLGTGIALFATLVHHVLGVEDRHDSPRRSARPRHLRR